MNKRPLGRTGLDISEVIFGGGFVGGIIIHADDDTRRTVVRKALDAGINWIDTAQSYGEGKSEEALGWLLGELPEAERPYLSTKFRLDPARLDDIPGQIEQALEGSLKRLRMDRVDLYQLHNPLGQDGFTAEHVLGPGGVCETMERLSAQGLFDHIGFTALGDPGQCKRVIESGRMATAQVYYNLINPSAGYPVPANWSTQDFQGLIDSCAENGVGVMNIRIFAAGVLTAGGEHERMMPITPNSDFAAERARAEKVFAVLGDRYGTWAQTALRFGLANPGVSGVIIGLAEIAHLEEALAGAAQGPLPDEAIEALKPLWASDFA
jgi:L-galactose dehydrogenase/L-glyceraldehyde 3-phosphate reductase